MFQQCDCSTDDLEQLCNYDEKHITSPVDRKCSECGEPLPAGTRFKFASGYLDCWVVIRTCRGCENLADDLCRWGYPLGELAMQIHDCLGFDYRAPPDTLDDD